jgi:hypothetical protein
MVTSASVLLIARSSAGYKAKAITGKIFEYAPYETPLLSIGGEDDLHAALVRWLGGAILVDRASIHQRDTLRAADAALRTGCYLALFPEGRINTTAQPLQPLEPGATAIARRAGAALVPLGIAGARELHFRRRICLRVGAPVSPAARHHGDDAVTEQLYAALLATLPPTPPPARWQPGKWLGRLT